MHGGGCRRGGPLGTRRPLGYTGAEGVLILAVEPAGSVWTVGRALAELPSDTRWELDEGRLEMREPAGLYHGTVAGRICLRMATHVEARKLGLVLAAETGFHLGRDPDTVRAPDVAFLSNERLSGVSDPDGFAAVPPDLAVEVLSPTDHPTAVRRKVAQYLRLGVRSVWVVDPRRRTLERHLHTGEVRTWAEDLAPVEDPTLPGFRCPLGDLLPVLRPQG